MPGRRKSRFYAETLINNDGSVMTKEQIILQRARRGQCQTCINEPVQLFEVRKNKLFPLRTIKFPLSVKGLVHEGVCLTCNPDLAPQNHRQSKHKKQKEDVSANVLLAGSDLSPSATNLRRKPSSNRSVHSKDLELNWTNDHASSHPSSTKETGRRSLGATSLSEISNIDRGPNISSNVQGDDGPSAARAEDDGVPIIAELEALVDSLQDNSEDVAAIEIVSNTMRDCPDNFNVQEYGISTLGSIAETKGERRDSIVLSGALDAIVQGMEMHITSQSLQEKGCATLSSLAQNPKNRPLIASARACDRIVAALKEHVAVENVVSVALHSLTLLSADQNIAEAFASQSSARSVAEAMAAHKTSATIAHDGCDLLSKISAVIRFDNQVLVASWEGIEAIVNAMHANPESMEIQEAACLTLENYSFWNANVETLKSVPKIRELLRTAARRFPHQCEAPAQTVLNHLTGSSNEADAWAEAAHRAAAVAAEQLKRDAAFAKELEEEEIAGAEERRRRAEDEERRQRETAETEERRREELAEERQRQQMAEAKEIQQQQEMAQAEKRREQEMAKAEERRKQETVKVEEQRKQEIPVSESEERQLREMAETGLRGQEEADPEVPRHQELVQTTEKLEEERSDHAELDSQAQVGVTDEGPVTRSEQIRRDSLMAADLQRKELSEAEEKLREKTAQKEVGFVSPKNIHTPRDSLSPGVQETETNVTQNAGLKSNVASGKRRSSAEEERPENDILSTLFGTKSILCPCFAF